MSPNNQIKPYGLIPYAGAKTQKAVNDLAPYIWQSGRDWGRWVSPMVGSGSVSLWVAQMYEPDSLWLNDLDVSVWAVWKATVDYFDDLIGCIEEMSPCRDRWIESRDYLRQLTPEDQPNSKEQIVDLAAKRIYNQYLSFSSYGPCADNPSYPFGLRWGRAVIRRLTEGHEFLSAVPEVRVTCQDYRKVLSQLGPDDFAFLDPPYFERSRSLYLQEFNEGEHGELADCLRDSEFPWILTYGDHPQIADLYSWADIAQYDVDYTLITGEVREETFERVITPTGQLPEQQEELPLGNEVLKISWDDLDFDHVKGLASSIEEKGIQLPIFIDSDGRVIDGRDRLLAVLLTDVGADEIPMRTADVSSDSERMALRLLLQATHKGMAWEKKAQYVQQLRAETGWSWPEIERQTGIPKSTAWRWVKKLEDNQPEDADERDETIRPVGVVLKLSPDVAEAFEGIAEKEGLTRAVEDAVNLLVDWQELPEEVRAGIPKESRSEVLKDALLNYLHTEEITEVA